MEGVNRKTVSEIFENPITGVKEKLQVSCAFTDHQVEDMKAYNLDAATMLDNAINHELEYSKGKKFIDAIIEYANDTFGAAEVNFIMDENIQYKILGSIKSFVFSCKSPKLYTNPYVLTVLNDVLENKNFDKQNQGYYYFAGEVKLKKEDVELTVPIYCIPTMTWNQTEAIMYDDEDRKRCLVMKFNIKEKEAN